MTRSRPRVPHEARHASRSKQRHSSLDRHSFKFPVSVAVSLFRCLRACPMHKMSGSHIRSCPLPCLSTYQWARPKKNHRHKGPHSVGGPCSNAHLGHVHHRMCVIAKRLGCLHRLEHAAGRGWQGAPRTRLGTIEIGVHFPSEIFFGVRRVPPGARQCTRCAVRSSLFNYPSGDFTLHVRRFFQSCYRFESCNNAW